MPHERDDELLSWCLSYCHCLKEEIELLKIALALYDLEDEEQAKKLAERVKILITVFLENAECHVDELDFNLEMLSRNLELKSKLSA